MYCKVLAIICSFMKKSFLLLLPLLACSQMLLAQTTKDSLIAADSVSLQQLLNLKSSGISSELEKDVNESVQAASKRPLPLRKSPSIISVISSEEIQIAGARDLVDVLRLVPGIEFGSDVQGAYSIVLRGNVSTEGKILLLLDGLELNENMYASIQTANRIPVEQIRRVEIIRGPGSAIYGGFAEYGVINIITKNADRNGYRVTAGTGVGKDGYLHQTLSASVGLGKNNWRMAGGAWLGRAQQGEGQYRDFYGNSYDIRDNQTFKTMATNLLFSYKTLSVSAFLEQYNTKIRDGFDQVRPQAYDNNYKTLIVEAKHQANLRPNIQLTSKLSYKYQRPWELRANSLNVSPDDSTEYEIYQRSVARYKASSTMSYDITKKINFIVGAEYFQDIAKTDSVTDMFYNGKDKLTYSNIAAYVQSLFKYRWANITIGARYDHHSHAGAAFAPRVGITKRYDKWHFKLLYGNSFRAPSVENINYSDKASIKPEKSTVIEFETGYQLNDNSLITMSLYDIETRKVIVYSGVDDMELYQNLPKTGSQGIEAEYRYKKDGLFLTANYAYYTKVYKSQIGIYAVEGHDGAILGAAQHKVNVLAGWNVTKKMSLAPSLNWLGKRYGYAPADSSGLGELKAYKSTFLLNFSVRYVDFLIPNLSVVLSGYNLFNASNPLLCNYYNAGGHTAMPNNPREILVRFSYRF